MFNDKTILITGGTGSFGRAFIAVCSCGWTGTFSTMRLRAARCWRPHFDRATDRSAA